MQAFRTAEKLKSHIKDWFKTNGKITIKIPKKGEYVKFKNFQRKIKSPFMIYEDFESIPVPEYNGKQNPNESYTNKYQKHVACSYKLVCVNDKFSKTLKSYLGENPVYNFLSSIIEENKYCSDVMKKDFNKEDKMTKEDKKDFEKSLRDHCHITGKYRGSAHRDCNINIKLNHKIAVVFHNLKIRKFDLNINLIPNGLEKYMSFSINSKLRFIDSF